MQHSATFQRLILSPVFWKGEGSLNKDRINTSPQTKLCWSLSLQYPVHAHPFPVVTVERIAHNFHFIVCFCIHFILQWPEKSQVHHDSTVEVKLKSVLTERWKERPFCLAAMWKAPQKCLATCSSMAALVPCRSLLLCCSRPRLVVFVFFFFCLGHWQQALLLLILTYKQPTSWARAGWDTEPANLCSRLRANWAICPSTGIKLLLRFVWQFWEKETSNVSDAQNSRGQWTYTQKQVW